MDGHIIGAPGRLVELRKWDIMVPEYQRKVDLSRVKRYSKQFDWFLFGVLYLEYRSPDYYVVDGRHRLEAARLIPEIDMVPCIRFDFEGPQHAAEVFVNLQRYRKPLATIDMHEAELFAGGSFGTIAAAAQRFVDSLQCGTVPLSTIRTLWRTKAAAFERVASLIGPLVGPADLRKDFVEAIVYLEDVLMQEGSSLTTDHRAALFSLGYERAVILMAQHAAEASVSRVSKIASPRMKAEALRWALSTIQRHEAA